MNKQFSLLDSRANISMLVEEYQRVFSNEYEAVRQIVKRKRSEQRNSFAEIKGGDYIERAILEYPETLFKIFNMRLSVEDQAYLTSKEGARWFASKFKHYSLAEKV